MRDVWIEIDLKRCWMVNILGSHPMRDVWIEIGYKWGNQCCFMSHPMRDVWIEIPL